VETLRPTQWSEDDILDEEGGLVFTGHFASDDNDLCWSYFSAYSANSANSGDDEDENADLRLWLTASGMFISFNAGEATSTSILGRVMDTGFRGFHPPEPESLD
jgi:hypothetical protein